MKQTTFYLFKGDRRLGMVEGLRTSVGVFYDFLGEIRYVGIDRAGVIQHNESRPAALDDLGRCAQSEPITYEPGGSLFDIEARFIRLLEERSANEKTVLMGRRLGRLYAALLDPSLILCEAITIHPHLAEELFERRLKSNTSLFLCVALFEGIKAEQPANSIGCYLRMVCRTRSWTWPTHPVEWLRMLNALLEDGFGSPVTA